MHSLRTISLDHGELVQAVQRAMADQLARDGRLQDGTELGLLFYAEQDDDLTVIGSVRRQGKTLFELKGNRAQLCTVAAGLALSKLSPAVRRSLRPGAAVRWRAFRFHSDGEEIDRFTADVEFRQRS